MLVRVRVQPGRRRIAVGGRRGDLGEAELLVRVAAPALEGRANRAAAEALAGAFKVPLSSVRLVSGSRSRSKLFYVEGAEPLRLAELLAGPPG